MLTLVAATVVLSGCTEFNEPISADSKGFWNEFIVWPLVSVIKYFADLLGSYAWGIIIVTIIIRLAILPLMIKQTKSAKQMQEIQPKMEELKKKYASKDQETQQQEQTEQYEQMKQSMNVGNMMKDVKSNMNLGNLGSNIKMPKVDIPKFK